MDFKNIVIIGGSAAGVACATRIRRLSEKVKITLIEENDDIGYSITGLPDFVSGNISNVNSINNNVDDQLTAIYNINVLKNTKATEINRNEKVVLYKNKKTEKSDKLHYDKLILATGSKVNIPKSLNSNAHNFFTLKNLGDAIKITDFIKKVAPKNVVIIGFNYYSLLLVNCFMKKGYNINIISETNNLDNFDKEFKQIILNELINANVQLHLNSSIKKFVYLDRTLINEIKLSDDTFIKANLVLYVDNLTPNIDLAKHAGLEIIHNRISVNNKMQTSDPDIYAAGTIAGTFNKITMQQDFSELINTSILQARIAASSIFNKDFIFNGIIKNKLLKINNCYIGYTGLNSDDAFSNFNTAASLSIYSSNSERFISSSRQIFLKLIYNKENKKILGAQISGMDKGIDKRLDIIHTAIYSNLTLDDLINLNFSYSPNISTYRDPINILGMMANNLIDGLTSQLIFNDIDFSKEYYIIDIRNDNDYQKSHLENSVCIPLKVLRNKFEDIPKDKLILIYCKNGRQGYAAERILKGNGFENVFNIEGGITSIKLFENIN